jgi:hypothetical protein
MKDEKTSLMPSARWTNIKENVANPKHYDADPNPDPSFHFDTNPDPTFPFDPDPDPAPYQSDANLPQLIYRPSTAPILKLSDSIVGVHGPPYLFFEPTHSQLLHFDFGVDSDPTFD